MSNFLLETKRGRSIYFWMTILRVPWPKALDYFTFKSSCLTTFSNSSKLLMSSIPIPRLQSIGLTIHMFFPSFMQAGIALICVVSSNILVSFWRASLALKRPDSDKAWTCLSISTWQPDGELTTSYIRIFRPSFAIYRLFESNFTSKLGGR